MRVTAEQFETRRENRVTGAYEIKPVNTERRGRKKVDPECDECHLKTEYLFDGFKIPADNARAKFLKLGLAVKFSETGEAIVREYEKRHQHKFPHSDRSGIVAGFCHEPELVKIRGKGSAPETWHVDFWQLAKPLTPELMQLRRRFQKVPAMVCQRCRPLSNLEIEEVDEGFR